MPPTHTNTTHVCDITRSVPAETRPDEYGNCSLIVMV
jgi:hypothetical protein